MLVIQDLQSSIYELLRRDEVLQSLGVTPHLAPQNNLHHPFIVISVVKVLLEQKHDVKFYNIEMQLNLYSQDHTHLLLLKVAERVRAIMHVKALGIKKYLIVGMNVTDTLWESGKDLKTTRLSLNYKLLIEEVTSDE